MAASAGRNDILGFVAAAGIGAGAFFAWAGWTFLNPQNVSWLRFGDRAMHTLGWWFFRASPWSFPIVGANPRNGLEISSSVALSDSLPLFAVPFKLLSPLLPAIFQYWGIWFLFCMIMQAVLGYAIGRELRLTRTVSVLLGAALVLTPAFLFRLPIHMALAGHWVLLAAVYLYVKQQPPRWFGWPLLLAVASAVHAYLLAMVLAVWVAALVQRLWLKTMGWRSVVLELALGLPASLLVLWSMGFFMTPSLGAEGFGFYRMNLDAFFDPNRWSWIVPDLPSSPGDYEGLVFPGLGVLLLLVGGIVIGLRRLGGVLSPRWLPLFVVALAMACFALSDKIILGHTELLTIPLPQKLVDFFSMFRASGRMVWLAGYLVVLLAFMLLAGRLKPRTLAAVASIAIVVQIADTSRGWTEFETTQVEPSATWPTPIHSPFWMFAARHYDKIRAIPVSGLNKKWAELSYFAAFHGMASDAAYLGRKDKKGFERLQSLASLAMTEGRFEPDALYVLDAPSAAIATRYMEPGDLLTQVDGFIVFARGGKALADAEHVAVVPYAPTTLAASE